MTFSWEREPVFCFTSDIDWASEEIIKYSHQVLDADSLKLTYFNTHPSAYLADLEVKDKAKLLIHPNFLPGSSQGETFDEVIGYCLDLVPNADGFRCHRYFEVNDIMDDFAKRGLKYFSNHCTRCETHLRPMVHRSGMVSFPIFLEDGGYLLMDPSLDFEALIPALKAPGLKIVNFHPAHMAFNTPDFAYTRSIKDRLSREEWNNIDSNDLRKLENVANGVRTTINKIAQFALESGHNIKFLNEIYEEYAHGEEPIV